MSTDDGECEAYEGVQAEVWALGVLLYGILFGLDRFDDREAILAYDGKSNYPKKIESSLKDLIEKMLCIDVEKRISLADVLYALTP